MSNYAYSNPNLPAPAPARNSDNQQQKARPMTQKNMRFLELQGLDNLDDDQLEQYMRRKRLLKEAKAASFKPRASSADLLKQEQDDLAYRDFMSKKPLIYNTLGKPKKMPYNL